MSTDIFLGGVSPYTPSEPATKSVEAGLSRAEEKAVRFEPPDTRTKETTQVSAPDIGAQPVKHLSFDELREMMRKVNMFIDPFEIQARFIVGESGEVVMHIVNTVSGEVIRRIPPGELERALSSPGGIRGLFTDRLA
jgi:uncharacterized FlaG/YvyC family protein